MNLNSEEYINFNANQRESEESRINEIGNHNENTKIIKRALTIYIIDGEVRVDSISSVEVDILSRNHLRLNPDENEMESSILRIRENT